MKLVQPSVDSANTSVSSDTETSVSRSREYTLIVGLMFLSAVVHLCGIRQDLPFVLNVDEPHWVGTAAQMVSRRSLNPGWFGHPGSTVFYPLAAVYHIGHTLAQIIGLGGSERPLLEILVSSPTPFYLAGRGLTIALAVLTIPVVYGLGKHTFGPRSALIGALVLTTCELVVRYSLLIRTDSATMFFGSLALLACFRALDHPGWLRLAVAGLAIGLAISTKFYLGTLVAVFLVIGVLTVLRQRGVSRSMLRTLGPVLLGLCCIVAAFALATPYLLIDWETASSNILTEMRSTHPGADGLSPAGNLLWYLGQALPDALGWPRIALVLIGMGTAIRSQKASHWLPAVYPWLFLAGISLSGLHWAHWTIAIMPVLALIAGEGAVRLGDWIAGRWCLTQGRAAGLLLAIVIATSIRPAYQVALAQIRRARPSTQILARRWILEHVQPGTPIAEERYTAPLANTEYPLYEVTFLSYRALQSYHDEGYRHLVLSQFD